MGGKGHNDLEKTKHVDFKIVSLNILYTSNYFLAALNYALACEVAKY